MTYKKTDLRAWARGKPCQLRLLDICNFDDETTVLHHVRRGGVAGMGQRPSDLCSILVCSNCHASLHGTLGPMKEAPDTDIIDGMCRTSQMIGRELGL